MTRTLFFLSCLAATGVALSAMAIRWELATPGVSLFLTGDGMPDGHWFNTVATAHIFLCFLTVMLIGTTALSAARDQGAPLSAVFMWPGIVLCVSLALFLTLTALPPIGTASADAPTGVGNGVVWTLFPPLSTPPASLLMQIFPRLDAFLLGYLGRHIALLANAMLYLGVYALAATLPKCRFMSITGVLTVVCAVVFTTTPIRISGADSDWLWIVALVAPFLVCAAISLFDKRRPWIIVLTSGMVFTVATPWLLAQSTDGFALPQGTMAIVALQYLFPMGLAWFALPALVLFTHESQLPRWSVGLVAPAIAGALCLWVLPLFKLGTLGMPSLYVDYPERFAPLNLLASIGVAVFVVVYLATMLIIRSTRA